jgi:mycothiol synthase
MHKSVTARRLRLDDAAPIATLLGALEAAEPVDESYNAEEVAEELTAPKVDLDRGSIGRFEGDRLVAFGLLEISDPAAVSQDAFRTAMFGGVHPAQARRGHGTQVARRLAADAAEIRDADAPGLPGEIRLWVDENRPGTRALAAAEGYEPWRYFFRMRAELDADLRAEPMPEGVCIRRFGVDDPAADHEAVRLVSNAAFADHWGSTPLDPERWRAEYVDSKSFRPRHSFVAEVGGAIVGYLMTAEFAGDTQARGYRTAYVSRIGTLGSVRGRGIGSALLAHTMADLAAHGYPFVELNVDADSPTGAGRLYERAGFVTMSRNEIVGKRF